MYIIFTYKQNIYEYFYITTYIFIYLFYSIYVYIIENINQF